MLRALTHLVPRNMWLWAKVGVFLTQSSEHSGAISLFSHEEANNSTQHIACAIHVVHVVGVSLTARHPVKRRRVPVVSQLPSSLPAPSQLRTHYDIRAPWLENHNCSLKLPYRSYFSQIVRNQNWPNHPNLWFYHYHRFLSVCSWIISIRKPVVGCT